MRCSSVRCVVVGVRVSMRLLGGSMDQLESVGKGGEPEISVRNARAVRASYVQVSAVNAHRVGAVFHNKKKGNARTSVGHVPGLNNKTAHDEKRDGPDCGHPLARSPHAP